MIPPYYTLPVTCTYNSNSSSASNSFPFLRCAVVPSTSSTSDQNVGMKSEPPPLTRSGPLSFFLPTYSIHHSKIPSFPKFHCNHYHGLPTACRKVSHFPPIVPQSIHHTPRLPVPPPSPTAALRSKQSNEYVEREGKQRQKRQKRDISVQFGTNTSLLESHRTVIGAISTELGGAG